MPLATWTTTSPTPVTLRLIQLAETASTKTLSTDFNKQFMSLYILDLCFYFLAS